MFVVSQGVVSTVVADEVTILDPASGLYFGLEDVAARVWKLLPATLDVLVEALCEEYEVEPSACREDVVALLAELAGRGLVDEHT